MEWKLFVTDENKVSSFTCNCIESKLLAGKTMKWNEMKDSMFPQPAAVTLNKTQFEKQ